MSVELESVGLNRLDSILEIANLNPVSCNENDSLEFAAETILKTKHRRIPIVNKRKLVGIITIMDLLDAFLRGQSFKDHISSIMVRDVVYCYPEDNIGYVLQKFKMSRRGGFPIINENSELIGLVSERDFVKHFSRVDFNIKIDTVMTKKPFVLSEKMSIKDSLKSIVNTHYRRLPVTNGKKLLGIVVAADFLRCIHDNNYNLDSLDKPITSILIKNVFTVKKNADVSDAVKLMKTKDVGGLLVIDEENNLEGIITERDILTEIV